MFDVYINRIHDDGSTSQIAMGENLTLDSTIEFLDFHLRTVETGAALDLTITKEKT